jgi:predicted DNA-binding transcriptional regulator AlpA
MEEQLKALIKEAIREVLNEIESKQPDEVLSVKQLCKWLGVSPSWVSENKDKLNIPHFKMGGDKFYRKDIERWIEENKVKKDIPVLKTSVRVVKNKIRIS